jgi:hypothetical protein
VPVGLSPAGGTITYVNLGNPYAVNTPPLAYYSSGNGLSNPDAVTYATGGGTSPYNGDYYLRAAAHHFLGFDGTEQARIITMQSAADYVFLQGGQSGFGPTLGCVSPSDTNVNCNIYAKGAGSIILGNGSGAGLEVIDPAATITNPIMIYGGTATLYPEIYSPTNMAINVATTLGGYLQMGGVTVASFGTGAQPASGSCYPSLGVNNTASYAKISGSYGCALYISTNGTGSIVFADTEGSLVQFVNSSANTVADVITLRTASATEPNIIAGSSANVYVGNTSASAMSLSTTTGYLMIPAMAGKNTGVPLNASASHPALYWDSTDLELCVYDTARHCSTAFPN